MIDLSSEQAFEKSLQSLSCNGCKFFIKKKCIDKDAEAHMSDKSWIIQDALNTYLKNHDEYSRNFVENIDNHFICESYESKE